MNVALIALPNGEALVTPPLSLAYVAAVLDRQRHIVRIYDLALTPDEPFAVSFRPLVSFRPQVVVVAGEQLDMLEYAVEMLHREHDCVIPIHITRSDLATGQRCAEILIWVERRFSVDCDKVVIRDKLAPGYFLPMNFDQLPFPARHLLSLERYSLRAVGQELQTTLLVGGASGPDNAMVVFRSPAQIVAELLSVSREYGIRHYLFPGVTLTADPVWLRDFLAHLVNTDLQVAWEGIVDAEQLDVALLEQMVQAGCETLRFDFNATQVFESAGARARLKQTVSAARQAGIYARADLELEPPYEAMPHLVDVASTFGLDDVTFTVRSANAHGYREAWDAGADVRLEEVARLRYHVGRSRQQFIDRFGAALGTLLWRLRHSRIGLVLASERGSGGLDDREDLAGSA